MKELSFETLIENITFSQMNAQIQTRLGAAGIRTIGDLVKKTRGELKSIRLFGNKCVLIVEDFLEENGWHLGMKEEKKVLVLPTSNKIDWEQRRYEIAMHILSQSFTLGRAEDTATNAVYYADALIKELKKGGEK